MALASLFGCTTHTIANPHAYIGAPPMLGITLIFAVIYLPALQSAGFWRAA
jgi:hypothetical protein